MALEQRNGNLYYYRSVREGKRVRRVYCGAGEGALLMARLDESFGREARTHAR